MLAVGLLVAGLVPPAGGESVRVGSKVFTEAVVLAEIATQALRSEGLAAEHRRELGGTRLLWNALLAGEIDLYPEYTGTIREEILGGNVAPGDEALTSALAERGVRISSSLGFANTYAIGVRERRGASLGLTKISDLARYPALRLGFSNEFMDRVDGWPGLAARYRLPHRDVRGLAHDLAYRALAEGQLDATDLYSTDAEIRAYRLRVLTDDLGYFPDYRAVWLTRSDLDGRFPRARAVLERLVGTIDEATMIALNARAKLDQVPESEVAASFLAGLGVSGGGATPSEGLSARLLARTGEHLGLVAVSLLAAIVLAIPLGIAAAKSRWLGPLVLGLAGILQTVPSLAMLVFMIPLVGIGAQPAILALFLYSLLPIVRNTATGLVGIPPTLTESALALGLPASARLFRIELPLASRTILAGIKTAAVINVGTATLGALVGAGGYGQPILTGIRLDDTALILEGAVPAALLALAVQGLFALADRFLVPRGLRLEPTR
ncbi:MAG TPA: glycine betaine ABC transporter substrate-binding protein [Thermoanaerobaculia bacterium]|nr:glycine betaine ABC transporter substrate-binding protein [Thermoanaerobaculia bacterium]